MYREVNLIRSYKIPYNRKVFLIFDFSFSPRYDRIDGHFAIIPNGVHAFGCVRPKSAKIIIADEDWNRIYNCITLSPKRIPGDNEVHTIYYFDIQSTLLAHGIEFEELTEEQVPRGRELSHVDVTITSIARIKTPLRTYPYKISCTYIPNTFNVLGKDIISCKAHSFDDITLPLMLEKKASGKAMGIDDFNEIIILSIITNSYLQVRWDNGIIAHDYSENFLRIWLDFVDKDSGTINPLRLKVFLKNEQTTLNLLYNFIQCDDYEKALNKYRKAHLIGLCKLDS